MAEDVAGSSMPQDILNTFYSGENPLCVMQNLREVQGRKKILIISDQRLMYFEENATGMYDDTLYAFARIDSAVFHEGKKSAELKIADTDGAVLKIDWLLHEEAERVLLTLQSAMNDLGTALVSLDKKKSMFSGEEWTLKKPVDYLTKTVKSDAPPMTESYVAPILPKDEAVADEGGHELFEESGEPVCASAEREEMDQDTVRECLKALRTLYDNHVLTEEQYRKLRLPLLEMLDI
ncbi:MAG: hypothetical protein O0X93_06635 [Methanocorpusculum sp.]|nr:hypothetical protein [Methanocorpusculum sp.]MDE2522823.1 hypothetical protein [Methanocorpusculum sp.]MDE2525285.1 hypothetical protein [Methanocorpusculum sp.]